MRWVFIIYLVIITVGCTETKQSNKNTPDFKEIDTFLEHAIQEWHVPGMAVGIIFNDTIVLSKGYGYINVDKKEPVTDSTIFGIASLTKSFTALAVGIAQKQNHLNVNEPIKKYLTLFETQNDSLTNNVNFVDILSHRTGFSTFSGDLSWYGSSKTKHQVFDAVKSIPVTNKLRTAYGYSNVMYLVAGLALETATGINFEDFVCNNIISPIDMQFTTFDYDITIRESNIATPHVVENNHIKPIEYVNWSNMSPSGGLFSNVIDLLKWARFQWNPNFNIIDSAYFIAQHQIVTKQNFSWLDHLNNNEIKSKGYGLGWEIINIDSYKIISHNGGLDGMTSQIVVIPDKKCAIVILANSSSALPIVLGYELTHKILMNSPSEYYKIAFDRIQQKPLFNTDTKLTKQSNNQELSNFLGNYYDPLMGTASIVKTAENIFEINFEQSSLFDAVLFKDEKDNIYVKWINILSLPEGKLIYTNNPADTIKRCTIECQNPDFKFEEVEFKRR